MRIAHIIAAHKNPAQLERLIKAMYHPNFDFFIHLDKKVDITPFLYLGEMDQVFFIKDRTVCNWGGFSFVEATMKSIDEIQQTGTVYGFINLISAQDYPIKSSDVIYNFFSQNKGNSFVSFDNSRDTEWWKDAENRYKVFHFTDIDFKWKYIVQKIANRISPERKFPLTLDLYGGNKSCWWTITFDCAIYLSAYFKAHPKLNNFLRLTWGSDEFIVATILMNSPYKDNLVNENYRYIDWSDGEAHPRVLTIEDYDAISQSGMLFARKLDIAHGTLLMDRIDTAITAQESQSQV